MTEAEVKKWTHILRQEKHDIMRLSDEVNDTKKFISMMTVHGGHFSLLVHAIPFRYGDGPLFQKDVMMETPEEWWSETKLRTAIIKLENAKQFLLSLIDAHAVETHEQDPHTEAGIA